MRVFCAAMGTETNSFSPIPVSMRSFEEGFFAPAGQHPLDAPQLVTAPLWIARQRARDAGWQVVEGLCAFAEPAGLVARQTYEDLRDRILDELKAALPVDAVLLGLHGAMMAHGYDDCEGDLLARVRDVVGPKTIIGGALDLHAHLSAAMVNAADLLIAYKEDPHTDFLERAVELVELADRQHRGEIRPVMAVEDCGLIFRPGTTDPAMRRFLERIRAYEQVAPILSVSVIHGFEYGDVADMGTKILVIADSDISAAKHVAKMLADELYGLRDIVPSFRTTPTEALAAFRGATDFPVVWADRTDNAGGGAASDSTVLLRLVADEGIDRACLGPLWDPGVVAIAHDAGVGAAITVRLGGKLGPDSGDPFDTVARVQHLADDVTIDYAGTPRPLGRCATLRIAGIEVVVSETRNQAFSAAVFTKNGVPLADKRLIVVKSGQHFRASFEPLAASIVYVDANGLLKDVRRLTYRKISRPRWPFDEVGRSAQEA